MKSGEQTRLKFATITALEEEAIYEFVIDDGAELDGNDFDSINHFLNSQGSNTAALVNKINQYTLGFDFQVKMHTSGYFIACAIVERSPSMAKINKMVLETPRPKKINACQFYDYDEAVNWLKHELAKA
ncbi:MAG: hypothetical protein K6L73_08395 [Cellvibrionaceae bacterium]